MKKKILLSLIVLIEIVAGYFFLINNYQKKVLQKKVLGASVTVLDKKNTYKDINSDLNYYWKFREERVLRDKPDWLEETAIYLINDDGLNDRFNYEIKKPAENYRIITLGDSFTFGHFINTENNWTEKLEDLLNKSILKEKYKQIEVINLGMPGYDVKYIAKRYQEIGAKYKPDLVIWFESNSGFSRFNELMLPIINECDKDDSKKSLEEKEKEVLYCWKKAEKEILKKYPQEYFDKLLMDDYQSFFKNVDQDKVAFIYFDDLWVEKEKAINTLKNRYPKSDFEMIVPILYPEDVLLDKHPNNIGHEKIAQFIFEYLLKKIN